MPARVPDQTPAGGCRVAAGGYAAVRPGCRLLPAACHASSRARSDPGGWVPGRGGWVRGRATWVPAAAGGLPCQPRVPDQTPAGGCRVAAGGYAAVRPGCRLLPAACHASSRARSDPGGWVPGRGGWVRGRATWVPAAARGRSCQLACQIRPRRVGAGSRRVGARPCDLGAGCCQGPVMPARVPDQTPAGGCRVAARGCAAVRPWCRLLPGACHAARVPDQTPAGGCRVAARGCAAVRPWCRLLRREPRGAARAARTCSPRSRPRAWRRKRSPRRSCVPSLLGRLSPAASRWCGSADPRAERARTPWARRGTVAVDQVGASTEANRSGKRRLVCTVRRAAWRNDRARIAGQE